MPTQSANQGKSDPTILIVDDDTSLRHALQEIFEFSGYTVLTASNARDGLQLLHNSGASPSLIISDILMEGMDGYQFHQAVQAEENWRDIPFMFLSVKGKLHNEAERAGIKAHGYLAKPFLVEDLLNTVERLLHQ